MIFCLFIIIIINSNSIKSGGDLACVSKEHSEETNIQALPTPNQGCQFHDNQTTSITRSQQNYIIKVTNSSGYTTYVWTGDRWQQAPDGIKGHEPQYWTPLTFDANGVIEKVQWTDEFILDV